MTSGPKKRISHFLTVEIKTHDPSTRQESFDSVHAWLETYGYTSVGHGFDFVSLIGERGKTVKAKPTIEG